jgi:hypothetical protein
VKDDVTSKRRKQRKIASHDDEPMHVIAASRAEQGDWSILECLLFHGWSRPRGISLTQAECRILFEILKGTRTRPRGRRANPTETENRANHLAAYSLLLELDGISTKAAVIDTMQAFDAKRSAVFAARKQLLPKLRKIGYQQMPPAMRQWLREWSERVAPHFWSGKRIDAEYKRRRRAAEAAGLPFEVVED